MNRIPNLLLQAIVNKHPIDASKKDTKAYLSRDDNDNNDELGPLTEYLCLICQTFTFIFKQYQTNTTTTTYQPAQNNTDQILNNLDLSFAIILIYRKYKNNK